MKREELEEAYLRAFAAGDKEAVKQIGDVLKGLDAKDKPLMDVAKGAASGFNSAFYGLAGGGLAAKAGIDPKVAAEWARKLTGGDYKPETTAGKYAQKMGTGAMPGPGGLPAALTGVAGGALAQFAEDRGYSDPLSQIAAWMLPSGVAGGLRALQTGAPYRDLRGVLSQMTPEERMATGLMMKRAAERGVPLTLWQAAPESSTLYQAGSAIAQRPGAVKVQEALRQQSGMGDQAWVRSMTEEGFNSIAGKEVKPRMAERIARAINQVGVKRRLDPKSQEELAKVAELFGKHKPGDQAKFVDALIEQLKNAPPGPERGELLKQVELAASGKLKAPPVFNPAVSDVGQAISAKGRIRGDLPEFASMKQGTLAQAREAIDTKLGAIPGYREVMKDYADTKKIAEIVARDQKLKGKHIVPNPERQGRITPEATVAYAIATNPWWASVPIIRAIASKQVARELDKAFAARNFAAIEKIAAQNPQLEGFIRIALQAMKGQAALPDVDMERTIKEYLPVGAK